MQQRLAFSPAELVQVRKLDAKGNGKGRKVCRQAQIVIQWFSSIFEVAAFASLTVSCAAEKLFFVSFAFAGAAGLKTVMEFIAVCTTVNAASKRCDVGEKRSDL